MYADNSILSKDASAFAKAYRSSANDVVTELLSFSVMQPSLSYGIAPHLDADPQAVSARQKSSQFQLYDQLDLSRRSHQ